MKRLLPMIPMIPAFLAIAAPVAHGASFPEVWTQVQEGPYVTNPEYQTTFGSFFHWTTNLLAEAVHRTLNDHDDILPPFQKLLHPIGICFAGTWTISEPSQYTGYFASGSQGQIIVRASEAMGHAKVGEYRAFGLAGKIFPTTDAGDTTSYKTANFFTIDDLGGTLSKSFFDLPKTNEPKTSFHASDLAILPTLAEVVKTFSAADTHVGIRQVYEISELGLADPSQAVTPHWLSLRAETTERAFASDFRDELRLANYPNGLTFGIYVAENNGAGWTRLGEIKLDQESLSDGCDHRLHFHHPKTK